MHTYEWGDKGEHWTVLHNSDLSGDVVITDPSEVGGGEMTIPAAVLIGLVAEWVRRERIAWLEQAPDASVLIGWARP